MKKKIAAILVLCALSTQGAVFADTSSKFEQQTIDGTMTDSELTGQDKSDTKEKFTLDVGMMSEQQIKRANQNFTVVDLKQYVNRDIKDDVAGDHQGGWSDQGDNDLRMFDSFGRQEMLGVPFEFINPANNGNKAVLGLRGQNDSGIPNKVEIPVNKKTAGVYFIQASPWCSGTCGTYTWVYEDGSESYMDIIQDEHICDFWGYKSFDFVRPAWTTVKPDGSNRSLYMFAMNNPHPDKTVKSLRLETDGGGAYIMIMAMTLTDIGPYLPSTKSAELVTMSTFGWFEYAQPEDKKVSGTAIDFSGYLDAPAGKRGRVIADGTKFKFTDGTEARFFGADICGEAAFTDKEQAEKAAERLSHCGINLVRFSGFDKYLLKEGSSWELDGEKLDKMAYFISVLKEKGIYTYISFLSNRMLFEDSGIEGYADFKEGYGIDAFIDKDLIQLQKSFVKDFLAYSNRYTGTTFGEEPSIIMAELVDSLSLYDYSAGYSRRAFANNAQYEKARAKFNDFLIKKYRTTDNMKTAWRSEYDSHDYESLEEKTVELKITNNNPFLSDEYKSDVNEFFAAVLEEYYSEMKTAFEGSDMLVTINSNNAKRESLNDTMANASTDFVTRSAYNASPSSTSEKISYLSNIDKFGSMIKTTDNIIAALAKHSADAPFVAHWGSAMPNLYFSEAAIMTAAFAGQKNWSMIEHSFANGNYQDKNYIDDFYSMYNNPVRLALAPVAASIFYSLRAEEEKVVDVSENKVKSDDVEAIKAETQSLFMSNTRYNLDSKNDSQNKGKKVKSVLTDSIFWDPELGIFETRCDKTEAVSGFLTSSEELPSFVIDVDNTFVTAALTALDDKNIKDSKHYLVTALCGNQNYKSRVNHIRCRYEALGEERIFVETITGSFKLKRTGSFKVWALNSSGERVKEVATTKDRNGYISFELSSDNKAIQYEIEAI